MTECLLSTPSVEGKTRPPMPPEQKHETFHRASAHRGGCRPSATRGGWWATC